ncbi:hypothetical protein [Vibrio taketomensis]|uniref:hypothetical protein n=1 Tax=Vibrio taketomensis TaxID=2572923 RepID=UPI0013896270|nr:hypothetical protein [Vibrio taketomensis]
MNLHSCTIKLNDGSVLVCKTVEQSLGMIENQGIRNINCIDIDAKDGNAIYSYPSLSIDESIENLMNL